MPMEQKEIESLIKVSIPDAEVTITDLAGDNNHFSAHITSSLFDGKTRIQQVAEFDTRGVRVGVGKINSKS